MCPNSRLYFEGTKRTIFHSKKNQLPNCFHWYYPGLMFTMKRLCTNSALIFMCLASSAETASMGIFSAFSVKYIQTQFGLSPGTSAMFIGEYTSLLRWHCAPQSENGVSTNIKHSRYIHLCFSRQSTSMVVTMYIIMFNILPLVMEEDWSSADHFWNFTRQKKVLCMWFEM